MYDAFYFSFQGWSLSLIHISLDFIYSQVKNLRKKLKQANASVELKAVYGFGYKLSEL